jgi:hypothetical protein
VLRCLLTDTQKEHHHIHNGSTRHTERTPSYPLPTHIPHPRSYLCTHLSKALLRLYPRLYARMYLYISSTASSCMSVYLSLSLSLSFSCTLVYSSVAAHRAHTHTTFHIDAQTYHILTDSLSLFHPPPPPTHPMLMTRVASFFCFLFGSVATNTGAPVAGDERAESNVCQRRRLGRWHTTACADPHSLPLRHTHSHS